MPLAPSWGMIDAVAEQNRSPGYEKFKARLQLCVQERDWKKFHNPKDLAIAISLEASELLEHFRWKNAEEVSLRTQSHAEDIREEAADIGIYLLELCDVLGVDLVEVMSDSGIVGGGGSREYWLPSPQGEDRLLTCACGYAANAEAI